MCNSIKTVLDWQKSVCATLSVTNPEDIRMLSTLYEKIGSGDWSKCSQIAEQEASSLQKNLSSIKLKIDGLKREVENPKGCLLYTSPSPRDS